MAKLSVEELIVEVTRFCNLDCEHCFRGDSQKAFMSIETINNLFSNIGHIDALILSGGEPLVALKQLREVANVIKRNNIDVDKITIITNGSILTTDIIIALNDLKTSCKDFMLRVSDDKFHTMALERKGLMNRRNVNLEILSKLFGATKYGTPRKDAISIIENVGRARSLTQDDFDRINSYGEYLTYYALSDSALFEGANLGVQYKPPYYAGRMRVNEMINIDVNGYLADSYASYEEADSHNMDVCNINIVTLLEAVRNNAERVDMVKEKRLR